MVTDFFMEFSLVQSLRTGPPTNYDNSGGSSSGKLNEVKVYLCQDTPGTAMFEKYVDFKNAQLLPKQLQRTQ